MPLPASGIPADEVLARIEEMKAGDLDHHNGRVFSLVFHAGEDHEDVVAKAHALYLWENALNPSVFPGLRTMTADVVASTAHLLTGGGEVEGVTGFLTSGGTESLLLAVKTAKVAGRERGIEHGNIVLATSAHAAFDKGCDYFGLEPRRVAVGPDYRVDVDAMADAVDDATVLVVGSAPQYPQGVVDDIPAVAGIAVEHGISCHVDACMGGFTLPFLAMEGVFDKPFDFRVPGVTTMSADVHKYGYTPKGVSVILHRDKISRNRQTFLFDGWLGGTYGSSGVPGTKPGGPIAAAWASFQFLGVDGFRAKARAAYDARVQLERGVRAIPGLTVVGEPEVTLCAIAAADASDVDVFAVMDALARRGWHLDRQSPPDSLHASCSPQHNGQIVDEFLVDLQDTVMALGGHRLDDRSTDYAALE
jgi:glutamate/tyrosine decarboxylase-like PLP-dependent enzyme